tara:strand:- start:1637 stop:2377 length:741 start_codon:yes stop_codon:yes gene_type:complete
MKEKKPNGIWELAKTVVWAVLIATMVRTTSYEPFNIPSGSMIPTLLIGDYLFVSKFSYGYSRYSLPFSPPLILERIFPSQPKRGDVAVFRKPTDTDVDYIKRVIGLPGDKIQIRNGLLYINGEIVERRRIKGMPRIDSFGRKFFVPQFVETLPNGRSYKILEVLGDNGGADNTRVFTVPQDHFFMMGDNRDNSVDSRDPSVGFVPFRNFIGQAELIFWSWNKKWSWWQVWNWHKAVRFKRVFGGIQ